MHEYSIKSQGSITTIGHPSATIPSGLAGFSVYLQGFGKDLSNAMVVRFSK